MSLTASPKRESGANRMDHHFLRNATTQSGLKKTDFKGSKIDFKGLEEIVIIREDLNRKKTFSFGHCPNHLNPPPDPNSGNLVLFISEIKFQDLKVSLELKLLNILYNILYICNLKNS